MGIGAAVGAVSGISSIASSRKQAKAAGRAADMSEEAMRESVAALDESKVIWERQLERAQGFEELMKGLGDEYGEYASQMWLDWESTFGGIRDNLTDYYENLDPDKYSVKMKAEMGQELDKSMRQFDETAAASGIYTSGMKLQDQKETSFQKAQAFAQADIMAPDKVNQMKQGFYGQFGEPARQAAEQAKGNAIGMKGNYANAGYNAVAGASQGLAGMGAQYSNLFNGQANTYANSAAGYGKAAGESMGSGVNSLMGGITGLFGNSGGGTGTWNNGWNGSGVSGPRLPNGTM